jgi:hypothetical protein
MVAAIDHDADETIALHLCWRKFKTIALQVRKRQRLVARRGKKYPRR